jgi:hypothetical protein
MMMTMMAHANSSCSPSLHRIVKWVVLVSSTMAGVLLVSLTIAELPSLETTTSTRASLHAAATLHQSTAEISMSFLVQDEKNMKSAADNAQLVPQQGQGRPTHEWK